MKRKNEEDNIDHNNKKKKKGAKWTEQEDQKLSDTIKTHGQGMKQLYCGKMRWMKNLRRRHFSEAEEDLIIKLHALLGDRWSLIAGRLPGRTDYEIENYWNSHMKEKLKSAGIDPNNHRVDQTLITTSSSTTTDTENSNTYEDTKSFISRKEPSRNLFEPRSSTRNGDEEEKEVAGFSSTELNLDLTIAFRPSSSSSSPSCFLRLEKKKKQLEENNDELLTDIIDTQNQQEKPTLLLFK